MAAERPNNLERQINVACPVGRGCSLENCLGVKASGVRIPNATSGKTVEMEIYGGL